MPESEADPVKNRLTFSKKVWITGAIFSLIIIVILLFKALFSVFLLSFTAILIALYFRGCADILHRNFNWPVKLCTFISVFINILLLVAFFWFVGARLQQQVSELSDTLPQTIQHAKEQFSNTTSAAR